MNVIDIGIVSTLLLFVGAGWWFGFTRKVLGILSWVGAGGVSFYAYPLLRPWAHKLMHEGFWVDLGLGVALFLVALFIFSFCSKKLAEIIKKSPVRSLDRVLGGIFGAGFGAFILAFFLLSTSFFVDTQSPPPSFKESKLLPYLSQLSHILSELPSLRSTSVKLPKLIEQELTPMQEESAADTLARLEPPKKPHRIAPLSPTPQAKLPAVQKKSSSPKKVVAATYSPKDRESLNHLLEDLDDQE